jgi:divalent metal cation (Fe/Co/Zn/Cd) transporter
MLAFMAISLIIKNRPYLIGKAMPEKIKDNIVELLECEPTIEKIIDFKSYALDVNVYRIKCEVEFNSSILLKTAYKKGLKEEYKIIKNDYEEFLKFCVDHTDRIPRLMGSKIDEIEKKIQSLEPSIRHIDIEIN